MAAIESKAARGFADADRASFGGESEGRQAHGGRRDPCECFDGQTVDGLTLFGLFAVTAMLVFYAAEKRSPWFVLAFAGACALGSIYGFLQGAWPFGLVEAIWALIALRRWRAAVRSSRSVQKAE